MIIKTTEIIFVQGFAVDTSARDRMAGVHPCIRAPDFKL